MPLLWPYLGPAALKTSAYFRAKTLKYSAYLGPADLETSAYLGTATVKISTYLSASTLKASADLGATKIDFICINKTPFKKRRPRKLSTSSVNPPSNAASLKNQNAQGGVFNRQCTIDIAIDNGKPPDTFRTTQVYPPVGKGGVDNRIVEFDSGFVHGREFVSTESQKSQKYRPD